MCLKYTVLINGHLTLAVCHRGTKDEDEEECIHTAISCCAHVLESTLLSSENNVLACVQHFPLEKRKEKAKGRPGVATRRGSPIDEGQVRPFRSGDGVREVRSPESGGCASLQRLSRSAGCPLEDSEPPPPFQHRGQLLASANGTTSALWKVCTVHNLILPSFKWPKYYIGCA